MTQRTGQPREAAVEDPRPLDVLVMRTAARRLLAEDAPQPDADELETLTLQLRGHIDLLIPEVETQAARLSADDIPRYCALACIGEARGKMSITPKPGLDYGTAYARRLARVVNALADHYENLSRPTGGARSSAGAC